MAFSKETEQQRFRSFAERYVVARAHAFNPETEQKDAWECALRARTAYEAINNLSQKYAEAQLAERPSAAVQGATAMAPVTATEVQQRMQTIKNLQNSGVPPHILSGVMKRLNDLLVNPPVKTPK